MSEMKKAEHNAPPFCTLRWLLRLSDEVKFSTEKMPFRLHRAGRCCRNPLRPVRTAKSQLL